MINGNHIQRLTQVFHNTGIAINSPFCIYAPYSTLSDLHIAQLSGWADLEGLYAECTQITDASLETICSFPRLIDLSIGGTAITSDGVAAHLLPPKTQNLGLNSIPLAEDAVDAVLRCHAVTVLHVSYCELSTDSLFRLAQLPNLQTMDALGADSTPEIARLLSQERPQTLFHLSEGLWQAGVCKRAPFPEERA